MTLPLNYTPKAIEDLMKIPAAGAPGSRAGLAYLIDKLRQAEVFVLGDHGQLLDRDKPRPEVPGRVFTPPFPVVALEYSAQSRQWNEGPYTAAQCSRRISLAWDWIDDLPPALTKEIASPPLPAGVAVASIAYYDDTGMWQPIAAAMHYAYDDGWHERGPQTPFVAAMLQSGRLKPKMATTPAMRGSIVPLLPEALLGAGVALGSPAALIDVLAADLMDEVNAYMDLCTALACKNVSTRAHAAPDRLNKNRLRKGRQPLKGFHVLELLGGGDMPGAGGGAGERSGPRSHLRRGHIRRLPGERVTWVNATIVGGRGGFVDKVYSA